MKKILLILLSILIIGTLVVLMTYNKPHRKAENEVAIAIEAPALMLAFETDEGNANTAYLGKALEVSGVISAITTNQDGKQVVLLKTDDPVFGVSCTMEKTYENISEGQSLVVKGFCKGYLADVVLTGCIVKQ